jgi:Ca2+-binding EF-hand superfamily protein
MSDSELRNSFGDTLREYDLDNSGTISITELGDAGEDFASSELSQRKSNAIDEAFQRDLSFNTQDGSDTQNDQDQDDESVRQFSVQEFGASTETKSVSVGQEFTFIRSYRDSQPVDIYELSSVDASDDEVELVPKTQELRNQRPDGQMKFTVRKDRFYLAKLPVDNPYRITLKSLDSSNGVQSADIQMIAPGSPEGEEDNGDTDTDSDDTESDDTESGDDDSDGEVKQIETGSWVDVSVGDTLVFGPGDRNELAVESMREREDRDFRDMEVMPGIGPGTISDDPLGIVFPEGRDSGGLAETEFDTGTFGVEVEDFSASVQTARIKIVEESDGDGSEGESSVEETDPSELEAADFTSVDYQFGEIVNVSSGEVLEVSDTGYEIFIEEVENDRVNLFEEDNGEYFSAANRITVINFSGRAEFKLVDGSKATIYLCSSNGEEARINVTEGSTEQTTSDTAVACGAADQQNDQEEDNGDDMSPGTIPKSELSNNELKSQYGAVLREYDADNSGSINADEAAESVDDFIAKSGISEDETMAILTARERNLNFEPSVSDPSTDVNEIRVTPDPPVAGSEVTVTAGVTESLAEKGYTIEVSGPDGFSESKDVSDKAQSSLSFVPSSPATYSVKLVPQSFANGLPFVEELVQSGAEAETTFEVDGADTSAWINYCNNNGYSIESLDQDLGVAGSCVSEEIVPAFFVEGGEGQDMEVPESLCEEVLGTGYVENQRACGTPGAA